MASNFSKFTIPELAAVMESNATRVESSLWNCLTNSLRSELEHCTNKNFSIQNNSQIIFMLQNDKLIDHVIYLDVAPSMRM